MNNKGKIVAFEGTDLSGKSTQVELLKKRLGASDSTCFERFPTRKDSGMLPLTHVMEGYEGISPKAGATLFLADMKHQFEKGDISSVYKKGGTVFLDRYYTSNLITQGTSYDTFNDLISYANWLDKFRQEFALHKATKTILLDIPFDYAKKLRESRVGNSRYDNDDCFLKKSHDTSLKLAGYFGWTIIHCVKDDVLRTKEDIHEEIYQLLQNMAII